MRRSALEALGAVLPNNDSAQAEAVSGGIVLLLVASLTSQAPGTQAVAAKVLREVAAHSADNQALVVEAGAVPLLVSLLGSELRWRRAQSCCW